MNKKPIIETLNKQNSNQVPIWLMRQAGRYMAQYRELRSQSSSFLELCYNPELAASITMQPIDRFGFDAAIIFSDILVIPDAMGVKTEFLAGEGPKLAKLNNLADINNLNSHIEEKLEPVYEAIRFVKSSLPNTTALIGFAGAPWTIATYMLEGGSSKDFSLSKKMAYLSGDIFQALIDKLIQAISLHLINQIKSGAEAVMIFDSWAGVLNKENFYRWVIEPTKQIIANIKSKFPHIPIIGFPKGSGMLYEDFVNHTNIDAISLDGNLSYGFIKENICNKVVIQGNMDPIYLLADRDILKAKIHETLSHLSHGNYIFNLGHGVLKETPEENVEFLIDVVRNYQR